MKGKCFRCGSWEHMANNCRVAKDVKCRSCGAQGHIQSATSCFANVIFPKSKKKVKVF